MRQRAKSILYAISTLSWALTASGADVKSKADRVMYISFQASNWDIYLFTQQGKLPKRLTDYGGLDYDPVVSPDRRWLVFTSERRGNWISMLSTCNGAANLTSLSIACVWRTRRHSRRMGGSSTS